MKVIPIVGSENLSAIGIIEKNRCKFEKGRIKFKVLDLINDKIPQMDLIVVRDCFVHFSFEQIIKAVENIYRSESTYLLTTQFHGISENSDIQTGDFRMLNLSLRPFYFPKPLKEIIEFEETGNASSAKKVLALYRIREFQGK